MDDDDVDDIVGTTVTAPNTTAGAVDVTVPAFIRFRILFFPSSFGIIVLSGVCIDGDIVVRN